MAIDIPKTLGEWIQKGADLKRAFKAAMRTGDTEGAFDILDKVEEIAGEQIKETFLLKLMVK